MDCGYDMGGIGEGIKEPLIQTNQPQSKIAEKRGIVHHAQSYI